MKTVIENVLLPNVAQRFSAGVGLVALLSGAAGSVALASDTYGDGSFSNNPMLSSSHFSHPNVVVPAPTQAVPALTQPGYVLPLPVAANPVQDVTKDAPLDLETGIAPPVVENLAVVENIAIVDVPPRPMVMPPQNVAPRHLPQSELTNGSTPNIGSAIETLLDFDWSVGLRGAYSTGTSGDVFSAILTPEAGLNYAGSQQEFSIYGGLAAEITDQTVTRVSNLNAQADGAALINDVTGFTYGARFEVSQDDVNAPGAPVGVEILPITFSGDGTVGLVRQFGQFSLEASANGSRTALTDTYMSDGSIEYSQDQNFWGFGGALRASVQATPILAPFVEVSIDRAIYDAAPISTGVKLDSLTYAVRGGAVATWQDSFTLETSTGYSLSQFDDGSLGDMGAQTFAISADFSPPTGVSAGLDLDTSLNPGDPDNAILASVGYGLGGSLAVDVSDRLTLGVTGDANWVLPLGAGTGSVDYSLGVQAAYALNSYAALALDYTYTAADDYIRATEYRHTIAGGLMVSRPE